MLGEPGRGLPGMSTFGLMPTVWLPPRAWVSQEIQEYLIEDSDEEAHSGES